MLNYKFILRICGFLIVIEGISMLLALMVALLYKGTDVYAFIKSISICLACGGLLILLTRKANHKLGRREGFIVVTLVWILFSFFGCLPFVLSNSIPKLTDAYFETMSGFTTTGASILDNIESLPHGVLFWRSLTQWLGGMGIIVLSLAILPIFGIGGMQLFNAEVPGIVADKLTPKIQATAKTLWGLYVLFTLAQIILLCLGGMSLFDAVNHSFTTMATGGFSTRQASVGFWPSPYIQYVMTFFMILAGMNFSVSYLFLTGKFRQGYNNEELRYYLFFIALFTFIIAAGLVMTSAIGVEQAFRDALFQVATIITTTGYATVDYMKWAPFLTFVLFAVFFVGGSTGSTGGGLKIMRIVLLLKNTYFELMRMIHPNAVIPVRFNGKPVSGQIIENVLAFFLLYVGIFFFSSILMMLFIPDFVSSMGAVATSMGNIGPGLGLYGPAASFSALHPVGKWMMSFLMLIGRLELFTVLILFTPSFWKN